VGHQDPILKNKIKHKQKAWGMVQVHLPNKQEALGLISSSEQKKKKLNCCK
jgi:hypothetical protein